MAPLKRPQKARSKSASTASYDMQLSNVVMAFKPKWFDDIPWHLTAKSPIDPESLFAIGYMDMIEGHVCAGYVHLALAPYPIRKKTVRTDFVVSWGAQQNWHGISLHRFIDQYAGRTVSTRIETQDKRRSTIPFGQKHSSLFAGLAASALPNVYTAVYACMGYRNELMTMHGYGSLLSKAKKMGPQPVLEPLLMNIMREEGEHARYYKQLATEVLSESVQLQKVVRRAMNYWWSIVGENYGGRTNADRVIRHLFQDANGIELAKTIDRTVGLLPGLDGINPMHNRVKLAFRRAPRQL